MDTAPKFLPNSIMDTNKELPIKSEATCNEPEVAPEGSQGLPIKAEPINNKPDSSSATHTVASDAAVSVSNLYEITVAIYLQSTGDDVGSECEIRGTLTFTNLDSGASTKSYGDDLPINSNFSNTSTGLGRACIVAAAYKVGDPPSFQARLWEQDTGGRDWILQRDLDFRRPENRQYADGRLWRVTSHNTEDNRYVALLTWVVRKLT